MQKKVLLLGGVIAVFAVLAAGRTYMFPQGDNYVADRVTLNTEKSTATLKTTPTEPVAAQSQTQVKTAPETVKPAQSCEEKKQQELESQDISYQKGSLLVTFNKDVSWEQGKQILALYNVKYSPQTEAQGGFTTKSWVDVRIPEGKELNYLCTLQGDENIKYVGVNQVFKLRE